MQSKFCCLFFRGFSKHADGKKQTRKKKVKTKELSRKICNNFLLRRGFSSDACLWMGILKMYHHRKMFWRLERGEDKNIMDYA